MSKNIRNLNEHLLKCKEMSVNEFFKNYPCRLKLFRLVTSLDESEKKAVCKQLFAQHKEEIVDLDGQTLPDELIVEMVGLSRKSLFSTVNGVPGVQKQTIILLAVAYLFTPIELYLLGLLSFSLFESGEDRTIMKGLEKGFYDLDELEKYLLSNIDNPHYHFESPNDEDLDEKHRLERAQNNKHR